MKIHTRTLFNIGATVFCLIIILALVAQFVILSSSPQGEEQESSTNGELVTGHLRSQIETRGESIHNQAVSDATYRCTGNKDPAYIRSITGTPGIL